VNEFITQGNNAVYALAPLVPIFYYLKMAVGNFRSGDKNAAYIALGVVLVGVATSLRGFWFYMVRLFEAHEYVTAAMFMRDNSMIVTQVAWLIFAGYICHTRPILLRRKWRLWILVPFALVLFVLAGIVGA